MIPKRCGRPARIFSQNLGLNNVEKIRKFQIVGVKNDDIGEMLVSGALDQTKKIRKTAADIFAKSGLEKP